MVPTPAADISVDADLVARLIRQQHPAFAGPLTLVASGWDNVVYRLGHDLCVRLPHRRAAAELISHEARWLPTLARQVGTPIPVPLRVGRPSAAFPWYWTITRWFDHPVAGTIPPAERTSLAADLATFFADLHTPAPADAPRNPVRGVPLAERGSAVLARLDSGAIPGSAPLRTLWHRLVATPPWSGPPVWLHGDPHPSNLLVTDTPPARLAAVIDFGDLGAGDPATDLAAAWLVFDATGRDRFRAELQHRAPVDDDTWQRAEGWALNLGTAFAFHTDDPLLAAVGRHTVHQLLADRPGPHPRSAA